MFSVYNKSNIARLLSKRLWILVFVLLILVCLYPVNNGRVRCLMLLLGGVLWVWACCLGWKRRVLRNILIAVPLLTLLVCILPARNYDKDKLRDSFVSSLKSYEGSMYYWGGENKIGIDCSGLIRKSLIMANFKRGLLTFNGGLIRRGIWLWWNDASARHMKNGYGGKTQLLFEGDSINELDHSRLRAGDFAITRDGSHALAYIGDEKWIQAEPGLTEVVILGSPDEDMGWYRSKVDIMRWVQFE